MRIASRLTVLLLVCCSIFAAEGWTLERHFDGFDAKDLKSPPTPGTIAFIGSSTFTMWASLVSDMAPLPVFNRAFGGSRTPDLVIAVPRLILPHKPKVIVYYCGDNDLAKAQTADPAVPVKGFIDFVAAVRKELPKTLFVYTSIKPSPSRLESWPKAQEANSQLKKLCAADPQMSFVDIGPALLDAAGKPREDLFGKDRLHLNKEGYRAIIAVLKPVVEKAWQAAAKN